MAQYLNTKAENVLKRTAGTSFPLCVINDGLLL